MKVSRWLKPGFWQRRRANKTGAAGFTLLELLISIMIGGIILTGLLYLVTEMLKLERRESAVDDVQRDMRRALDYIAADVSEAIYVYIPLDASDPAQPTTWENAANDFIVALKTHGEVDPKNVVLAFWRPVFLDDDDIPPETLCGVGKQASALTEAERNCRNLRERNAYYSLVVYQVVPHTAGGIWEGEARLTRYELPMYTDPKAVSLTPGYLKDGPIDTNPTDGVDISFESWAPTADPAQTATTLVDFVNTPVPVPNDPAPQACRSADLVRVPPTNATNPNSFFTCIRIPGSPTLPDNQNLEIYLQGNINPADGINQALGTEQALSDNSRLPMLSTGVFVQGIIGFDPDDPDL